MKNQILILGKVLNKTKQKEITGGRRDDTPGCKCHCPGISHHYSCHSYCPVTGKRPILVTGNSNCFNGLPGGGF
ncbi:hypothetical protein OAT18_02390 [Tenacibaculum sp.]|nr:hypothetical protein [Tenacibaculum sp.]